MFSKPTYHNLPILAADILHFLWHVDAFCKESFAFRAGPDLFCLVILGSNWNWDLDDLDGFQQANQDSGDFELVICCNCNVDE